MGGTYEDDSAAVANGDPEADAALGRRGAHAGRRGESTSGAAQANPGATRGAGRLAR